MDGLTISTAKSLLNRGETMSEIQNSKVQGPALEPFKPGEKSFAQTLNDAVQNVNQLQKTSDQKMQDLATGKNKNISDVMITAEKADIALRLMVQVRNKIIEAYQEVMKMQV